MNASLTDCAVNSLPQYFQNSLENINAKVNMTELGVTQEVDWRDHLIYCFKYGYITKNNKINKNTRKRTAAHLQLL